MRLQERDQLRKLVNLLIKLREVKSNTKEAATEVEAEEEDLEVTRIASRKMPKVVLTPSTETKIQMKKARELRR